MSYSEFAQKHGIGLTTVTSRFRRGQHPLENRRAGLSLAPEYTNWLKMRQRCKDKNNNRYHSYGQQGVKVCKRWDNSFELFLKDMGPKPTPVHTIDRIDVTGDYTPENCRWADRLTQSLNKRVRSKTGVTGVALKQNGKYKSTLLVSGKALFSGTFDTLRKAAAARNLAILRHNVLHKTNLSLVPTQEDKHGA